MTDYTKLADKAKAMQDAAHETSRQNTERDAEPGAFFQKVATYVVNEMEKANLELSKKKVGAITRHHAPSFQGIVFLTFGAGLACRVSLESKGGRSRITASILGPPNGYEISRREYLLGSDKGDPESQQSGRTGFPYFGARPDQIAVDIISGLLSGGFD